MAVLVLVAAGACRGSGDEATPTTVAVTVPPTEAPTTVPPTTTLVTVPGKPRSVTTLSSALGPGTVTLGGTVAGPEGPVTGATVRVERLVGDEVAATNVTSGPGGQWTLPSVNGGRYRLRAWHSPELAMLRPTLVFVEASENKTINLTMARYGEGSAVANFAPGPPTADKPAALVVTISNGTIDGEGVLHASPRPGVTVQLAISAGLTLESPDTVVTDGAGNATFTVRCAPPSPPAAAIAVAGARKPLDVPPCAGR